MWSWRGLRYLKPPDFDDLSGEFALESSREVFFNAHVGQCFQDRHWSLWKVSEVQTVQLKSRFERKHHVHTSRTGFTSDSQPGGGAYPFGREDNTARVLQGEVGHGEAVDPPIGAHPPLVVGFHPDAVFLPNSLHVRVRELHFEGGRLSFEGFLVSQGFADADFTGWNG